MYSNKLFSFLKILLKQGLIDAEEFDFLLRFPVETTKLSPVSFLSSQSWGAIKVQCCEKGFIPIEEVLHVYERKLWFLWIIIDHFHSGELQWTGQRHRELTEALEEGGGVQLSWGGETSTGLEKQEFHPEANNPQSSSPW